MVALNTDVIIDDIPEHQTTLCKLKRGVFVEQGKNSTYLPDKNKQKTRVKQLAAINPAKLQSCGFFCFVLFCFFFFSFLSRKGDHSYKL